mgnify:CR=1 FL=1
MDEYGLWPEEPPGGETQGQESLAHIIEEICRQINAIQPKMADASEQRQLFELLKKVSEQPGSGLKPRTEEYIRANIHNFITIYDEETLVACGEIIELDSWTIELGAVATNVEYQNQWMSDKILDFAEKRIHEQWKSIIIVTDNPILIRRLEKRKYTEVTILYSKRNIQSPGKKIYTKFKR